MRNNKSLIALGVLVLLLIIGFLGFYFWTGNVRTAMPEALSALDSDELIQVEIDPWLIFSPIEETPITGLIIYPGGLVEPEAYARNAWDIAASGYLVVIPPMPFNLAVFGSNIAGDIINAYPKIENWGIGGHSLGGSMAASYSNNNPNLVDGLVLWASYPAGSDDLSESNLVVFSIFGTLDGVATPEEVLAGRYLLPQTTTWVPIEGGNHGQFGWYGHQDGDNPAVISHDEQDSQIVAATTQFLMQIEQ